MKTIEKHLNQDFSILVDWFVAKTKFILFSPEHISKSIGQEDNSYKDVKIKQSSKVTYLGRALDKCPTGESMAMQVCTKVTSKKKVFILKKTGSLNKTLGGICLTHLFHQTSIARLRHGIQILIKIVKKCRF